MDPFLSQITSFGFAPRPVAQSADHEEEIDIHDVMWQVNQQRRSKFGSVETPVPDLFEICNAGGHTAASAGVSPFHPCMRLRQVEAALPALLEDLTGDRVVGSMPT